MKVVVAILGVLCASVLGCEQRDPSRRIGAEARTRPLVLTTFYPTTYLATRIVGAAADVRCLAPADADPATWQPSREVLLEYQGADAIVINGAGFEKWLSTASLPESRVIDSSRPLRGSFIQYQGVTHSHGPGGLHTHAGADGHTWLDPLNAREQAAEILRSLSRQWPQHAAAMQNNYESLAKDLDELDAALKALTPMTDDALLMASHPAYNYLARRYSLNIVNLDVDPEQPVSEKALTDVAEAIAKKPTASRRIMLWEEAPVAEAARVLQEKHDVLSVVFTPCETLGDEQRASAKDYLSIMRENVQRLREALERAR